MTSADILSAAGRALYGQLWQSQLARDLDVSDRTIRRWAAGQEPPATVWADIRSLLAARREQIRETLRSIPK